MLVAIIKNIVFLPKTTQAAGVIEYNWVRSLDEIPGYDTKQSDGDVPVILGLWRMQSNPSLPLLPGPL